MTQSNEPNMISTKYTSGSCVGCGLRFAWCTCNGPKDAPMGWCCPVCGRGLAPHVNECSCVDNSVNILERMKHLGIIRTPKENDNEKTT